MGNPMTSLGDMIYGNAVGIPLRVAANTTTTKKYLSMTGDGTSGDQPFWDTITGFIGGSGTTGYIPKFTSSTAIGNSLIYDDGTNIGIATISPTYKLDVSGTLRTTGNVLASNVISLIGAENNSAKIKAGKFLSIADDGFTVGINYTSDSIPFGGYNLMVNGNTYNNGTFYNNSNASIGTPTQDARLRVAGAMNSTQAIFGNVDGRGLAISTVLVAGTNEAGSILNARGVGGGTFIVQTDGTERVRVASTGQLKLNAYTSVSSFSGTIAGLLAFDSSGNVIARNNVVDLTLSTTGNNGAATYNTITGALNIPEYTLDGLGGMGNPMTSLGDMIYGNAVGIPLRVPANTTTTKKFLAMTGDGTSGDQPFWETITSGVSGTTNYVAKFTSSTAVGNSLIYDNGTSVLINTTSTTGETLQVNGSTKITSGLSVDSTTLVVDATNDRVGVGSASPNARLQISGGSLATGGSGAMISTNLSTGRLDSYDTNSVACLHTYLDAHSYEISAGSTANYISGISITGGGATLHTGTIRMFANSLERFTLKTTGQIALTAYNSATSFTGTPVAYLACDSSGNIITSNPSGIAKYMSVALSTVGNTWLDMPAALSFFDSSNAYVTQLELSSFNQVRLVVNKLGTAGATGSKLILRYQDTTGAPFTASSYSDIGTSEVSVTVDVANNILVSSWINLATAAKDDVWVALLGIDGDGAIDPTFGNIYAEFRYNP
jgi:hypothetical protein